jgi:plasmid maintenance system antidote protein VapI
MSEFGDLMKKLLDEQKIGNNTLSKLLKISRNHVSDLIAGQRNPSPKMVDRICEKLKLPKEISSLLNLAVIKDKGYKI